MHLFAYGTLMFLPVWERITGRRDSGQPATLSGHSVYRVRDASFPGLRINSDPSAVAEGLVYRDLEPDAIDRLDAYEDDFYRRVAVEVQLDDGEYLVCETYLVPEEAASVLSTDLWTGAWFLKYAFAEYLARLDPTQEGHGHRPVET